MADDKLDPDKPSSAYALMEADWRLVRDVRAGTRSIREAGETYLPKFPDEQPEEYRARVAIASWSPHYEDATRSLIGKPFSKEVKLQGTVPQQLAEWCENVDLAGHNLHDFAKRWFGEALHMGVGFVLVDYPVMKTAVTIQDERDAGARPYLRLIPVDQMRAIYTGTRNGQSYVRQIRFMDDEVQLDDMEETLVVRRRVLDDVDGVITQRVYVKGEEEWALDNDQSGPLVGINAIPLVALVFGMPDEDKPWAIRPTMLDLANKQLQLYRHDNRLDQTFDFAGFPMLQAKGMAPPMEEGVDDQGKPYRKAVSVIVGPRSVLFAPPAQAGDRPEWDFVEPSSQSIEQMRQHRKDIESEIRTLGLQPHMPSVGVQNMAATTSAISAARTHSTIQAWAFQVKDAIEQAFVFMARWAKLAETAEAFVHTDFSAEVLGDADEKELREMFAMGVISWDTYVDEMSRRGILGPQFDKNAERLKLESGEGGLPGGGLGMPTDPVAEEDEVDV